MDGNESAFNAEARTYTRETLRPRVREIDEAVARYLTELDLADEVLARTGMTMPEARIAGTIKWLAHSRSSADVYLARFDFSLRMLGDGHLDLACKRARQQRGLPAPRPEQPCFYLEIQAKAMKAPLVASSKATDVQDTSMRRRGVIIFWRKRKSIASCVRSWLLSVIT